MMKRSILGTLAAFTFIGLAWAADTNSVALQLLLMGNGLHTNDWGTQTNANLQKVENAIAGYASVAVTGGTVTLTDNQARNAIISFDGILTSTQTIVVPARFKTWIFANNSTGAYSLYVKTPSGSPLLVGPTSSYVHHYMTNGVIIWDISSDLAAIGAVSTVANAALPKAGGTMSGNIAMGSNGITGLATPSSGADATTKSYVDSAISTAVAAAAAALVPTGAIMPFYLTSCPSGWVAANGSGAPDLRGYFVRGWGNGAGVDPDSGRSMGSVQAHQFQDHQHNIDTMDFGGGPIYAGGAGTLRTLTKASGGASGNAGSETRPVNVALLYCMKS